MGDISGGYPGYIRAVERSGACRVPLPRPTAGNATSFAEKRARYPGRQAAQGSGIRTLEPSTNTLLKFQGLPGSPESFECMIEIFNPPIKKIDMLHKNINCP